MTVRDLKYVPWPIHRLNLWNFSKNQLNCMTCQWWTSWITATHARYPLLLSHLKNLWLHTNPNKRVHFKEEHLWILKSIEIPHGSIFFCCSISTKQPKFNVRECERIDDCGPCARCNQNALRDAHSLQGDQTVYYLSRKICLLTVFSSLDTFLANASGKFKPICYDTYTFVIHTLTFALSEIALSNISHNRNPSQLTGSIFTDQNP